MVITVRLLLFFLPTHSSLLTDTTALSLRRLVGLDCRTIVFADAVPVPSLLNGEKRWIDLRFGGLGGSSGSDQSGLHGGEGTRTVETARQDLER